MNTDDYRLNEAIKRIKQRIERISVLKAHFDSEIDAMVDEAQIDIISLQLQLDANRIAMASIESNKDKK